MTPKLSEETYVVARETRRVIYLQSSPRLVFLVYSCDSLVTYIQAT